jgi:hypothetical protein
MYPKTRNGLTYEYKGGKNVYEIDRGLQKLPNNLIRLLCFWGVVPEHADISMPKNTT